MSTATGQHYQITTLNDLLQLDERQLDQCLRDMKSWVAFRREIGSNVETMKQHLVSLGLTQEQVDVTVEMQEGMTWVDDGLDGGDAHFEVMDEQRNTICEVSLKVDGDGKVQP